MNRPYSVMKEPVIPVIISNGRLCMENIRDVLCKAHEISDLQCSSPLETIAVFRLLVAIAMDMTRPQRWMDRQELLEKGRFDSAEVDAYISACESNGPCFDLFDSKHPFMQTAFDPKMDEKAIKPVALLSVSLPSGNNHIFLDHRMESAAEMSPGDAFRALLTTYLFCTATTQDYPSGINNTPPVYSRIMGENLYETIVLNMISTREHPSLPDGYDLVPWRNYKPVIPKQECVEMTMMEALTWQPRRICLLPDEDGYVRRAAVQQGKNFRGNEVWRDPHVAYRRTKKGEWVSVKPQAGRALWRDVGVLLADKASEYNYPPAVVSRAADLLDDYSLPLQIQQVGVITNQASYVSWIEDRLALPICLLNNEILANIARSDTEEIEWTQNLLAQVLNRRFNHTQKNSIDLAEQARLLYLTRMHDALFSSSIPDVLLMETDCSQERIRKHTVQFHARIEKELRDIFRNVVQNSGNTADDLQQQTEAESEIFMKFRKYAKEREARYE